MFLCTAQAVRLTNTIELMITFEILIGILVLVLVCLWFVIINSELRNKIETNKELINQVENMANHDPLTGLPNRRLLFDRINRAIIQAKRNKRQVAVCVLDLNGFKRINDECGHPAGDQILREFANRVTASIRESDSTGRLGGDEFLFIAEDELAKESADALVLRLEAICVKPFAVKGKSYQLSFSSGIACYPNDGSSTEELVSKADQRMYEQKTVQNKNYFTKSVTHSSNPEQIKN